VACKGPRSRRQGVKRSPIGDPPRYECCTARSAKPEIAESRLQLTFDLDAERVDSLLGVEVLALPATAITGLQLTRSSPRLLPIFHVRLRTDAIASP
jgi:hypothetical protein